MSKENKAITRIDGRWIVTFSDGHTETFDRRDQARAALKAWKASH